MISLSPLKPADYRTYKPFFANQRYSLCGYSLASIIAWTNDEYKPLGGIYRDAFIVAAEFETETHKRHLLLPISPDHEFSPVELAAVAEETGHTQFWFVPESYVDRFGEKTVGHHFTLHRHAAFDDYVYRVQDLAGLRGNRYSKKRNLIKQFQRGYVDTGKVILESIAADNVDDCLAFLENWCLERDCDGDDQADLACEKQAAINALVHMEDMELKGILLRIDGEVNAFGISAPLTEDMATLQYEKAYGNIKGLYQYFDNACARMLFDGYTYLNKESDMGIPGLAKAKKSYYPVEIVRAFKLVLNS